MPIRHHREFNREFNREFTQRAYADPFSEPGIEKQYPPDLELEPQHLDIAVTLDIPKTQVICRVATTVRSRRNGADSLILQAVDLEEVNVITSDAHPILWRYDGKALHIRWENGIANGEQRTVTITYRVVKPVAGLYFSQPDAAYPNQPYYAATDHETERARYWLPCIDLPNVRTTLDIHLRAESRLTALANGALVGEEAHGDGSKTTHWRLDQRCPSYLICFAVGDFVAAEDGTFHDPIDGKSVALAYYCSHNHTSADLLRTFGRTRAMLDWMTRKLDMAFPYPKYFQFALPGITGAMENISLVSWDEKQVQSTELQGEYAWFVDQVNVHEMAHSYFGDAVVCRDFAHAWLKESWATYIEQVWREDSYSADEAAYAYYLNARDYFEEADSEYNRPIITRAFRSSWDMYDRHLYEGGACRLHTLRCELGDETFWAATRAYLQRFNGKVVESDDFRLVLEEVSGRSLGRLFDQWFATAGYPNIKVSFEYDHKRKQATFEVEQTQVSNTVPAFVLNTDLAWVIDGVETRWPIRLEQAKHTFVVPMAAEPQMVRFDPGMKVLHKLAFNPGDEKLRRQLVEATDMIGRIRAASELAKTGKRANIQAIIDAYANEAFWGVRREFSTILGRSGSEVAIEGLAKAIAVEHDPNVMRILFDAASNYRDPRLVEALTGRLNQGLPPMARGLAYEALGAQRHLAPLPLLLDAATRVGESGIAQVGALHALAATRKSEAIDALIARLPYGATPKEARFVAPSALAAIGKGQEKATRERIVETLVDTLRDPQQRSAKAAAYGLSHMRASEASAAIEAFARRLDWQQQVEVERSLKALRSEDKSDGSTLKKQVEELTEKLRKLEDQVQKLQAQSMTRDA